MPIRQILICNFKMCDLNRGLKYKYACKQKEIILNVHGTCYQYQHQEHRVLTDLDLSRKEHKHIKY